MCRKLIFPACLTLVLGLVNIAPAATNPHPADGAIYEDIWVILSWRPGAGAVSYDVYVGDNFAHVNDGTADTFRGNQTLTFFVLGFPGFPYPDSLVPGTTYYWRIDEVNDAGPDSPWKGEVWSFTIKPIDRRLEIVSGPLIQEVTQNSAVIFWETNEDSNSVVKYSKIARLFDLENEGRELGKTHSITLTGLEPSTTYHFVVQSADLTGNVVESKDIIFETLPLPDHQNPTVSIIDPGIVEGTITVSADANDNTMVENVEFFIDGESVYTDYSWPYELSVDTTEYDNGDHTISATVTDLAGGISIDDVSINVGNVVDVTAPSVNIYHPSTGATILGDQSICVVVSDDNGVSRIEFFIDGKRIDDFNYPTTPSSVDFPVSNPYWWDTRTVWDGQHRIGVRATDIENKTNIGYVDVTVNNGKPPKQPNLVVTKHEVTRHDNILAIDLTVENWGGALRITSRSMTI